MLYNAINKYVLTIIEARYGELENFMESNLFYDLTFYSI